MRKLIGLVIIAMVSLVGISFATEPFVQIHNNNSVSTINLESVHPSIFDEMGNDTEFFDRSTDGLNGTVFNGLENDMPKDTMDWLRNDDN